MCKNYISRFKKISTKKLLSSSILTSLVLATSSVNITTVQAGVEHGADFIGKNYLAMPIASSTLTTSNTAAGSGLYINDATNLIFDNSAIIQANMNTLQGVDIIDGKSITFNASVVANENLLHGIQLNNVTGLIFNAHVTANQNESRGISISSEGTIFNSGIEANKNDSHGLYLGGAHGVTFNGPVIAGGNIEYGVFIGGSNDTTFNDSITANGNKQHGVWSGGSQNLVFQIITANNNENDGIHLAGSPNAKFQRDITANENGNYGIYLTSSEGAIFNDDIITNKNTSTGLYIVGGVETITFNGDVISTDNTNHGIHLANTKVTFNDTVTASNNMENGILLLNNATATFNNNVVANDNTTNNQFSNGIAALFSSNLTFNGDVTASAVNKDQKTGIYGQESTFTFDGNVTVENNTTQGIFVQQNTGMTFNGNVVANKNNIFGIGADINSTLIFNGNVNATDNKGNGISIRDSDVTFNGNVTADDILLDTQAARVVTFGNGALDVQVSAPIITKTDGENNVTFNGSTTGLTITTAIGEDNKWLKDVRFTSLTNDNSKNINLSANAYSRAIHISDVTLTTTGDIILTSPGLATGAGPRMHLNNAILNLKDKTLTLAGVTVHDDANADIIINTTFDGKNAGHIAMASLDDSIDLTNSKNLIFNITDAPNTPLPAEGAPREVDMFVENGGALTLNGTDKTIINSDNQFVIWSFNSGNGVLTQTRKEVVVDVLQDVVNNEQNNNIEIIANNPNLLEDILNIAANEGGDAATQAIERLTNSDAVAIATAPVNLAIQESTQVVSNRAETISGSLQTFVQTDFADSNEYITGVSAGSDINKYGAWVSPIYGISKQGARNNAPGYKSSFYGIVLGFDALINDKTALGVALSAINTDIKHKHQNAGDRTKADSYIFSGYGTYEISKEWFVQGVGSIGRSKIKNKEIRNEFGQTSVASASYNATSWGVEALTGYNQKIRDNLVFTPLFGFEFNRLNGIKYKETGTRSQNLSITRKGTSQLEAILGARLTAHHTLSNITLVPEIHGNIRYGLLNKKLDVDIRQDGVAGESLVPRSAKQVRSVYNIGFGMNAKTNDKWEYAIGYDARFANKYVSHQGTMKVRLNF